MEAKTELGRLRERMGLSQADVGLKLNLTQSGVSRLESKAGSMSLTQAADYASAIGVSVEKIIALVTHPRNIGPEKALDLALSPGSIEYTEIRQYLKLFEQRIRDLLEQLGDASESIAPSALDLGRLKSRSEKLLRDLHSLITRLLDPPRIALGGTFTSGKTTIVNSLLGLSGDEAFQTKLRKTTQVLTFIRHESLRPDWMTELDYASDSVFLFESGFQPSQWREPESVAYLLDHGGLSLLQQDAPYNEVKAGGDIAESRPLPEVALVFLSVASLAGATIIDTPGFQAMSSDSLKTERLLYDFDVLLYASKSNGFLCQEDRYRIRQLTMRLEDNSNYNSNLILSECFFIAATWADPSIHNREDLEEAIDYGIRWLLPTLSLRAGSDIGDEESIFGQKPNDQEDRVSFSHHLLGSECTIDTLRKRCFTFWQEAQDSTYLRREIDTLLQREFPAAWKKRADTELEVFRKAANGEVGGVIQEFREFIEHVRKMVQAIETLESKEQERVATSMKRLQVLKRQTNKHREACKVKVKLLIAQVAETDILRQNLQKYETRQEAEERFFTDSIVSVNEWIFGVINNFIQLVDKDANGFARSLARMLERILQEVELPAFNVCRVFNESFHQEDRTHTQLLSANKAVRARVFSIFGISAAAIYSLRDLWRSVKNRTKLWQARLVGSVQGTLTRRQFRNELFDRIDTIWEEIDESIQFSFEAVNAQWVAYLDGMRNLKRMAPEARERSLRELVSKLEDIRSGILQA